ncbi:hypothetical protein [uncultured Dokdonia sp.]|uniref:plasmid mobilization protein n=1 Tax=uncultured Dokdonia sp. TaxID=575653 RepID=UPI002624A8ED|nr:hypothetical protein [uncultured Dokdonia sp.]
MNRKIERISIRVTSDEKTILQNEAKKYQTNLSNYLISAGLRKEIYVRQLPDIETEKLKMEIAQVGRNLWLLVKLKRVFQLSETLKLEMQINLIESILTKIRSKYDY